MDEQVTGGIPKTVLSRVDGPACVHLDHQALEHVRVAIRKVDEPRGNRGLTHLRNLPPERALGGLEAGVSYPFLQPRRR